MTGAVVPLEPCLRRPPATATRRLWLVLGLTASVMVAEVAGGLLSGSLALLADAGHMLTDVGAIALSIFSAWMARRPARRQNTFGYLRVEILAAFVNGAALLALSGLVVWEAVQRLARPAPIEPGLFLGVALVGLVANAVSLWLLHGDHHHSLNTRGAYLHILGDALGSVGAVAAAGVVALTGWTLADPIISLLLAGLIVAGAWRLVRESTDVLLEAAPAHVAVDEVERRLLAVPGVTAVHDLHVWTVTSGMVAIAVHCVAPDLAAHPGILARIREAVAALGIGHVTVQLETGAACEVEPVGHRHGEACRH